MANLPTPQLPNPAPPHEGRDWASVLRGLASHSKHSRDLVLYLQQYLTNVQRITNAQSTVGLLADRPPAGNAGVFYRATDVGHLYQDDGTVWQLIV